MKSPIKRHDVIASLFFMFACLLMVMVIAVLVSRHTKPVATVYNDAGPKDEVELIESENPYSFVATDVFGALPPRDAWIGKFRQARARRLDSHPLCEACGQPSQPEKKLWLNAHHKVSVKRIQTEKKPDGSPRWDPSMQWDEANLIMLCPGDPVSTDPLKHQGCHLRFGHTVNGHASWQDSNKHVQVDADANWSKLHPNQTYEEAVAKYRKLNPAADVVKPRRPVPAKTTNSI